MKNAERSASMESFQIALECISSPVLVSDRGTLQILAVNQCAIERYGFTRDEFSRKTMRDLLRHGDLGAFAKAIIGIGKTCVDLGEWQQTTKAEAVFQVRFEVRPMAWGEVDGLLLMACETAPPAQSEAEGSPASDLLRAVIETCSDALYVKDLEGKYLVFNRAATLFVGREAEYVIGKDDTALFESVGARRLMTHDREVMQTGQARIEEEVLTAAGVTRTYITTKTPYRDHSDAITGLIGTARDITRQKTAEQSLRQSEERYRTLVEATTAIVWNTPESGEFETEQPAWTAFTGQSFAELQGWGWLNAVHPDDRVETEKVWSTAVRDRITYIVEHRLRRADGAYRYMAVRAVPILKADGTIREWVGLHSDVTEQRVAAIALSDSEAKLAEALRMAEMGYWNRDIASNEIEWSAELYGIFGIGQTQQPLTFNRFLALVHPDDRPGVERQIADAVELVIPFEHFYRIVVDGEIRVISERGRVIPGPDGRALRITGTAQDVTTRLEAEEALRSSELQLRQVVENQTEIVFRFLADGTITFANDAYCRMFGSPDDGVLGRRWHPLTHPDEPAGIDLGIREMSRANPVTTTENRVHDGEGREHWMEFVNRGFFGRNGELIHVQSVGRDITDRRTIEAALRESESRFRAIFNSTFQLVGVLSMDGTLLAANQTSLLAGGLQEDEAVGLPFWKTRWWTISAAVQRQLKRAIVRARKGEFVRYEVDVRGAHESVLTVDFSLKPIRNSSGEVSLVLCEGRDVTEQKAAEQALQLRDRAVRAIGQGIVITDSNAVDDPIIYVNPGFEAITGYRSEEALGRNCRFLQGPDTDPSVVEKLRHAVSAGVACTVEILNYRKDGEAFWNAITLSPVHDDTQRLTHIVGVQVDATERKRLEERLRQSEKMEAIGQLAGGVAHDFNNMLAVINGYSATLSQSDRLDASELEAVTEVQKAGQRAAGLTRQLLAFSRKQVLKPTIVNVNEVIVETKSMLSRLIGEDVSIASVLEPSLWPIRIDPGQLEQIILNLSINSRDAMPQGGTLTIETSNLKHSNGDQQTSPTHYVKLTVRDTGCGMDESVRERAFEPFFTTKEQGKGTGLGLASVYGIVQQSGGQIFLDSEPGRGATFTILFPALNDEQWTPEKESETPEKAPRGSETLLVVEDEEMVRRLLCKVLASQGYSVLGATSGRDALEHWNQRHRDIALVITDVVMPEMSGRQLIDQLRQQRPNLKVLFMSGYTDDEVIRHNIEEQSVHFIQKPFSPFALAAKVRAVLASEN